MCIYQVRNNQQKAQHSSGEACRLKVRHIIFMFQCAPMFFGNEHYLQLGFFNALVWQSPKTHTETCMTVLLNQFKTDVV